MFRRSVATQPGIYDEVLKALPLLPVVGFIFAFCHEGAFSFFLGIDPRYIIELTDIVRASALSIIPAIPVILIGAWLGETSSSSASSSDSYSCIAKKYANNVVGFLIQSAVYVSAVGFFFFGIAPELSINFTILVFVMLGMRLMVVPLAVQYGIDTLIAVWMLVVVMAVFAGMGAREAYNVRSGDIENLPVLNTRDASGSVQEKKHVIRRFSSGVLVTSKSHSEVIFLPNDGKGSIIFEINPEPFQGVLCNLFDWCLGSGWIHKRVENMSS